MKPKAKIVTNPSDQSSGLSDGTDGLSSKNDQQAPEVPTLVYTVESLYLFQSSF